MNLANTKIYRKTSLRNKFVEVYLGQVYKYIPVRISFQKYRTTKASTYIKYEVIGGNERAVERGGTAI